MFEITEIELGKLAKSLENYLKNLIQSRGYVDSGNLLNSIKIYYKDFELQLETAEYLQYLDEGKLLEEFLEYASIETVRVLEENIGKDIINQINIK